MLDQSNPTEIRLGIISQSDKGYFTKLMDNVSESNYEMLLSSIWEVNHFENRKRLFEIVIYNSNEFTETVTIAIKYMLNNSLSMTGDKEEYYKQHLNFNRLFLNYLSSFRTFIDHSETTIKRKFGKTSDQADMFKKITNGLFDEFFSYRFLCKLRNYSQHCGLPIDEIEISATKQADETFIGKGKIEFDCQKLLSEYKEWGPVKKDLIEKSKISIFPILDELHTALMKFWNAINQLYTTDLLKAVEFIELKAGHLKADDCKVCLFTDIRNNENGTLEYFTSHQIPFDVIATLEFK
ncbi:hypothetical protein [Flavobacterium xinjiangense]|uniref:Uncharacterized protein n=1 Tax=Flavobacterium xinjiangense TaxID=178356 RepID=A0A1M7N5U2_9FLAO|nr:hypothetical protein [Flavobacterium xinjiangense]SHM98815.1 hypothetical protein SAMN05216269_11021 [Flavobacterium xinjiangense]